MNTIKKYIVVDDDPFNNILCGVALKRALGPVNLVSFTEPEEGLSYITGEFANNTDPTILFLDINMPSLTGWEFMEQYEKFDREITKHIYVYILSSSVDHRDKEKAEANPLIVDFISKPLDPQIILNITSQYNNLPG